MKSFTQKQYVLRTSDFTQDKQILPSTILDLFQDVAGYHTLELGCSLDDFAKKGLGWVLIGVKYQIIKPFNMYSTVKVKTWPLKPSFAKFQREYQIFNEQGELLVKGSSMWTIIDLKARKVVPVKEVYIGIDEYLEERNFEGKFPKISILDKKFSNAGQALAKHSDLDMNRHVNNVKYINYIVDCLGEELFNCKNFLIEYHKELMLGDTVSISSCVDDGATIVKGNLQDELIFVAQFSK